MDGAREGESDGGREGEMKINRWREEGRVGWLKEGGKWKERGREGRREHTCTLTHYTHTPSIVARHLKKKEKNWRGVPGIHCSHMRGSPGFSGKLENYCDTSQCCTTLHH